MKQWKQLIDKIKNRYFPPNILYCYKGIYNAETTDLSKGNLGDFYIIPPNDISILDCIIYINDNWYYKEVVSATLSLF